MLPNEEMRNAVWSMRMKKDSGPPFAVSVNEVESLYREHAEIRPLAQRDALAQNLRFRERGLDRLQENIFLPTLRN